MVHRPLPNLPSSSTLTRQRANQAPPAVDPFSMNNPYFAPYAYPSYAPPPLPEIPDEPTTSTVPTGTFLHRGFYDLLAMIPTPSPSRLFWGTPNNEPGVAGPRYEDIKPPPGGAVKASPKKGRRISKDMVSKPTGFVCVCYCHVVPCLSSLTCK
jgi:hypothetical protein